MLAVGPYTLSYTQLVIGICTPMRVRTHAQLVIDSVAYIASTLHSISSTLAVSYAAVQMVCCLIALHRFAYCTYCRNFAMKHDRALSAASKQARHAQGAYQTSQRLTCHHRKPMPGPCSVMKAVATCDQDPVAVGNPATLPHIPLI